MSLLNLFLQVGDEIIQRGEEIIGNVDPNQILNPAADAISESLFEGFWNSIPPTLLSSIEFMMELGIYVMIAVLIFTLFNITIKIFGLIFGTREFRLLKKMNNTIQGINLQLEALMPKKAPKSIDKDRKDSKK